MSSRACATFRGALLSILVAALVALNISVFLNPGTLPEHLVPPQHPRGPHVHAQDHPPLDTAHVDTMQINGVPHLGVADAREPDVNNANAANIGDTSQGAVHRGVRQHETAPSKQPTAVATKPTISREERLHGEAIRLGTDVRLVQDGAPLRADNRHQPTDVESLKVTYEVRHAAVDCHM